jgi:hypothetical protein
VIPSLFTRCLFVEQHLQILIIAPAWWKIMRFENGVNRHTIGAHLPGCIQKFFELQRVIAECSALLAAYARNLFNEFGYFGVVALDHVGNLVNYQ